MSEGNDKSKQPKMRYGVLGHYINEDLPDPQMLRLLTWSGRLEVLEEEEINCYFVPSVNRGVHVKYLRHDWAASGLYSPQAKIRISLLPYLRNGTLWDISGEEVKIKNYFLEREFHIENPYAEQPQKFYQLNCFKAFKKQYELPAAAAKSFVLRYTTFESPTLTKEIILPCLEMARFYLFNSSTLTRIVLEPGSLDNKHNKLFIPPITPVKGLEVLKSPKIIFREVTKADMVIAARIAFSKEARQAVLMLQQSYADKSNYGYIKTHFPFSSSTNLILKGIEVEADGVVSFLALEILSCSGHFPFDGFEYSWDWPISEGDGKKKGKGAGRKPGKPDPDAKPKPTRKRSNYLSGILRVARLSQKRFTKAPDLDKLIYIPPEKKKGDPKDPGNNFVPDEVSDSKYSGSGKKKKRAKLEAITKEEQDQLDILNLSRFDMFEDAVDWLLAESVYRVEILMMASEFESDSIVSHYPVGKASFKRCGWCFLEPGVPRSYAIAEIQNGNDFFYLIEHAQRRLSEKIGLRLFHAKLKNKKGANRELGESDIEKVLQSFADNYGKTVGLKNEFSIYSFHHEKNDTAKKIAMRILKRIRAASAKS